MTAEAARTFLETVQGFTADPKRDKPSQDKPIRIAVVQPDYSGGLVQVRFEGEDGIGQKGYASISSYNPQPNDRVVMVPIGTTYLIMGRVDPSPLRFAEWRDLRPYLVNGWTDYTAPFQADPEFIRSADGWVKLKGLVSGGDAGNEEVVAVLPEGYRPTGQLHFATVSSTNGNATPPDVYPIDGDRPAMLRVRPNGEITCGFGCASWWLSLDAITFVAEV